MPVLPKHSTEGLSNWSLKLKADLNVALNSIPVGTRPSFKKNAGLLSEALPAILTHLSSSDTQLIKQHGLEALNDLQLWSRFEFATEKVGVHSGSMSRLSSNLTIFIGYAMKYINNESHNETLRPSVFKVEGGNNASITPLYRISVKLLWEFKELAQNVLGDHPDPYYIQRTVRDSTRAIAIIAENPQVRDALVKQGFSGLVSNDALLNQAISNDSLIRTVKDALVVILRGHSPEKFPPAYLVRIKGGEQYSLRIGRAEINVTRLGSLAPILVEQAQEYADHYMSNVLKEETEPKQAKDVCTHLRGFVALGRTLYALKGSLNSTHISVLKAGGFKGFLANNGELLRWCFELREGATTQRKRTSSSNSFAALTGVVGYFTDTRIDIRDFYPDNYLKFSSESVIGEYEYMDISHITKAYPALGRDLQTVYKSAINSLKADALGSITISSRLSQFQRIMKLPVELSTEQRNWLSEEGLAGFVKDHHSVLKAYLEIIQSNAKSLIYAPETAWGYQVGLKWVIQAADFDVIDVYPVKLPQSIIGKQKADSDDYYTKDEVIELAYYIEVLLAQDDLPQHKTLFLRIARILLKTGWNQSPVLTLETLDILEVDCPLAGQKTYFVRLFKKRAGYQTQWYKFELSAEEVLNEGIQVGATVKAVLKELIYLSNTISKPLRDSLPPDHPFKNSLMLYDRGDGVIRRATDSILYDTLSKTLPKSGCSVRFSSRRIRKTGMNYIYRRVEKDFSKYKKVGQHSFEVFQRDYLRMATDETERTLSKAITVMGDYFHGRPITDDIKIVTEFSDYWQQVPNGGCASQGNDVQAAAYNRKIHGLTKLFDIEKATYCADFSACLWCEHYRCVADPEHIWRLLSYRDFVLEDMDASIEDIAEVGAQKEYHRLLTQRVNEVLGDLNRLTSGCREAGEKLLAERGIHPDWQTPSTTSTLFRENK